jgi:hypothetical protein
MMEHFSKPSWAEELGINMDELRAEHPFHPEQLRNHRRISRQASDYWARERFLARVEYSSQAIIPDTVPEPVAKPRVKRAKVGRYEFTEAQLQIALRSLNEKGAV